MFRNVRFYRFGSGWPKSENEQSELLEKCAFTPCGPLTIRSSGWVAPRPDAGNALARNVNGADLIMLRSQSRVLPPAAIKEELELRIEDYRERMQEEPPAREKRRMKAEARDELMPKALLKSDRIFGYVDPAHKLIAIDAAQSSIAERFLRRLGAAVTLANVRPPSISATDRESSQQDISWRCATAICRRARVSNAGRSRLRRQGALD